MSPAASQAPDATEPVLLSPMEEGFFRGPVRAVLVLRLDGCLEADFLAEALQRVQRRHPKLRAVVAQRADGRKVYHVDETALPIPFEIKDYDEDEGPWREEAARLLGIRPPPAGSWAAITVLRNRSRARSELILSVHHGIADGRSVIMLVDDMMTEYANLEAHLDVAARPALPVISAPRARELGGWLGRLRLLRRFARLQWAETRSRQTPLPAGRDIPPLSQWVHWVLSREDTLALVRRCRKEQVSFTGALVAAAFCGLMECLAVSEATFKWFTPFDVRETLEVPTSAGALGSFAAAGREFYKVRKQPAFWDLAKRVHQDIQRFVQYGGPALAYNMSQVGGNPLFPPLQRLWERLLRSGALRPTLFVTHYGVVDLRDAYGSLRPREGTLIFKGDEFTGHWLLMEGLVLGQRLNIGFAGNGLEPAFWERLHPAVHGHLSAAAHLGEAAP